VRLREHRHNIQQDLLEKSKPNMHMRRVTEYARMTLGFWKLKATAGIENTKNRPIWHAQPIQSANPVWTFLLYGSPSSTMRSSTRREDLYDVTDRSRRSRPRVFRLYSTDGTTGGYYTSRFPTHREDLYDVTDSSQASVSSVSSVQDALHRWKLVVVTTRRSFQLTEICLT
jgi:hypothetical protein